MGGDRGEDVAPVEGGANGAAVEGFVLQAAGGISLREEDGAGRGEPRPQVIGEGGGENAVVRADEDGGRRAQGDGAARGADSGVDNGDVYGAGWETGHGRLQQECGLFDALG